MLRQIFWRSLFIQCVLNFDKMQNSGFATAMLPVIKRLFPDGEEQKKALLRNFEHFNTQPYMANLIIGLIAAKEEKYASSKDSKILEGISYLKEITARSLAALGDTFFWGTWRPFISLVGIIIVASGIVLKMTWLIGAGVAVFLIVYNLIPWMVRWYGLRLGYEKQEGMIEVILKVKPVIGKIIWWIQGISLTILACFGVFLSSQMLGTLGGHSNLISHLLSGAIVIWVAVTLRRISISKVMVLVVIVSVVQAYVW
ncbi:MAG: PTS system mannose/fructose/sorbose family transporter subunit IID [Candidatus Desantisbacteria bacterium]